MLAGLRTVGEPDLGWQLATGRWIIQHHIVPSTDIFSYTVRGREWIYPALSQIILFCSYQLGGYSLLSWLSAAACVGTTALLLRGGTTSKVLAVVAVPIIATWTPARAEMFTLILFAAFVNILWFYHRSGQGPLWALPPLMCIWVNLHPGFIAGLGMCAAYLFLDSCAAVFRDERAAALTRLRRASAWLLATIAATLLNPWGPRIYLAISRQAEITGLHSRWNAEWLSSPLTLGRVALVFAWRDGRSVFWWLLVAVLFAIGISLYHRRIAPAALLGICAYLAVRADRFQGLFAVIAVIIGGSILADGLVEFGSKAWIWDYVPETPKLQFGVLVVAIALLGALVSVRGSDLVSNRYYLRPVGQFSVFGPGVSWWYPEGAAAFIARERLPVNIFNDFNLGGFVSWRLSPAYADYIDGRAVPFGGDLFLHSLGLLGESLDSDVWQQEADTQNINTIFVSVDRLFGSISISNFCRAQSWRPVYLDTQAAVFVRVRPENANMLARLPSINCQLLRFDDPPPGDGIRGRSEQFNYYLNSAAILIDLGRNADALRNLKLAERILPNSEGLKYAKGLALQYLGDVNGSERELRLALEIDHSDQTSRTLARLYRRQQRPAEAAAVLRRAVDLSQQPYQLFLELGDAELAMDAPKQALRSFDNAEKNSPFTREAEPYGASFNALLARGRTLAWQRLAADYEAQGLHQQAMDALRQAASIANTRR